MKQVHKALVFTLVLMLVGTPAAQATRILSFSVELPNGAQPQFKAVEGKTVSAEIKDRKYGFVPTIESGNDAVVRMSVYDLSVTPHELLGTVDVTVGGDAVKADTTPSFTFRVLDVRTER